MANELRVRQGGIGGAVETALAIGGTTLDSAGLAAVAGGIGSTQHMAIVLDPDGIDGAPEVAYITALTAVTTSATIARGQEGTTARAHKVDIPWVHCPTVRDFAEAVQTTYTGTTNPTRSTNSYADIDATLYPALSLVLYPGEVIDLMFRGTFKASAAGNILGIDWLIDRPTSADTSVRAIGSKYAAWLHEWPTNGVDGDVLAATGTFVVTEAGAHTFKPQWRPSSGSVTIMNDDPNYFTPSVHRVTRTGFFA